MTNKPIERVFLYGIISTLSLVYTDNNRAATSILLYLFVCGFSFVESTPHLARASGDDHASTGVPPQFVETKPND